jgi:hypothetical protein
VEKKKKKKKKETWGGGGGGVSVMLCLINSVKKWGEKKVGKKKKIYRERVRL